MAYMFMIAYAYTPPPLSTPLWGHTKSINFADLFPQLFSAPLIYILIV
jgi:hypothetical protein